MGRDRGASNPDSSALTLVSSALTSLLSALFLVKVDTIRVSVVIRPDKPSRVSEDCACNCEKPNTNKTTTTVPIPIILWLERIEEPPCSYRKWIATTATSLRCPPRGRNAPHFPVQCGPSIRDKLLWYPHATTALRDMQFCETPSREREILTSESIEQGIHSAQNSQ